MSKRRVSFRLNKDEALVIAPIPFWDELQVLFNEFADDPVNIDHAAEWREAADHVRQWVERTRYVERNEDA